VPRLTSSEGEGKNLSMLFDDLLKNPLLKKAVAAGEEQAGKVVGRLLSSDAIANGLQGLLTAASTARATFDAGVKRALEAANLPSASEVQSLRQKLDELEALLDDLSSRVGPAPSAGARPGPGQVPDDESAGQG
jgi:hypothetical protein